MSPKMDDGYCVFGSITINKYLDALRQEIDGVRQNTDIEFVHRMRVASRRIRSALPLFADFLPAKKYPQWKKEIRAITQALGAARDTDVQLDLLHQFAGANPEPKLQPGVRRLILRLSQKRAKFQVEIERALDKLADDHTLAELQDRINPYLARQNHTYLYTPALYTRGYNAIFSDLGTFLSYEPYIEQPEKIAELHAMRIAGKHLRYTMEIFAPLYPDEFKDPLQTLRKAQDMLGEVHDCDVWVAFLPEFIARERQRTQRFYGHLRGFSRLIPGIQGFMEDRKQTREKNYQDFVSFWKKDKTRATWQEISQSIQIPYNRVEAPVVHKDGDQPVQEKA